MEEKILEINLGLNFWIILTLIVTMVFYVGNNHKVSQ